MGHGWEVAPGYSIEGGDATSCCDDGCRNKEIQVGCLLRLWLCSGFGLVV